MPFLLVWVVTFVPFPATAADHPRELPAQAAAADLRPVTVAVVDSKSGTPVKEFKYQASYDAPGRESPGLGDAWTPITSPSGTFEIKTPPACRLIVMATAPDYIGGYPMLNEFVIKKDDVARRVVIRLRKGITVKGTVLDSRTKAPVAGATVAPMIHVLPIWVPDEDKEVKTGADGRYAVRGVDPELGVSATHPDYVHDLAFPEGKTIGPNHDILLKPGVTIPFTVIDTNGKPMEGVTVYDLDNKKATSAKDGKLNFRNPDLMLGLTFHKDGYIDRKVELDEIRRDMKRDGFVVAMEPSIALTGRVVAEDGRPVAGFAIAAGPGKLPPRRDSVRRDISDKDGRFALGLAKEGAAWVGVAAEGHAAWEGRVEVKRGGQPLEIRLSSGVAVTAKVVVPESLRGHVKAKLVPRRDKSEIGGMPSDPPAEEFPTRTSTVSADGTVRFEHVRPDRYRLIVEGRGAPDTTLAVDVPDSGFDVGAVRVDLATTTGRIEGQVWHPKSKGGGVWSFAKGYVGRFRFEGIVESDDGRSFGFQADENGRFKVDRVPAGLTTVGFPYAMYDVINSYTWSTLVVEGKTTVVGAFDPAGLRELTLAFAIGDGSKAQYESGTGLGASRKVDNVTVSSDLFSMLQKKNEAPKPLEPSFRVELTPLSKGPLSYARPDWEELDAQHKIVLPDVGSGTYRLRLYDWLGLRGLDGGPLLDREVIVPSGLRKEVRVELGAGCITGKIPALKENFERPVEVTAVLKGSGTPSRRTRCDDDGNFCVRYLSPGTYSVLIHDPKTGFCRVDNVQGIAGVVDIGEHVLSPGAKVTGEIHFPRPSRVPDEVVAVGPSGVTVRREFQVYSSFDWVELNGLWPGHWRVSALCAGKVLTTGEVDVKGTETIHTILRTGGGDGQK